MSETQIQPVNLRTSFQEYWHLTKPRVVALIVFICIGGMAFAYALTDTAFNLSVFLAGTVGIGLSALGAAVANCLLERSIDTKMNRTKKRATATGRVALAPAMIFSMALLGSGLIILVAFTNPLTAWLTLATFIGYAFIYTLLLKPNTPQNIVIGGASGAMPPVLGWVAVTGSVDYQALLLFLIVFVWTPPHFWVLALCRKEEYRKASIPMLPVTHGEPFTRLQILLYSIALFAVCLLPWVAGMAGWIYLFATVVFNAIFIGLAIKVFLTGDHKDCWKLFCYSGPYLMFVFAALMVDTLITKLA